MLGLFAAITLAALSPREECADEGPVRVTVVVVLANSKDKQVDPKLKDLAEQVQKRDRKLTGFKLVESIGKSIAIGDSAVFALIDKKELKVKVEKPRDENGQVGLTIKPPELGEISYSCVCDKFFPVVTPYKTKTGERLIVVVMAKPCTQKKKK